MNRHSNYYSINYLSHHNKLIKLLYFHLSEIDNKETL